MPTVQTPPTGAGGLATIQAGKYAVRVNIGTIASPEWRFVRGLTNYEPKTKVKLEDDTTIESDGWGSSANAGNEYMVDIEGLVVGDNSGASFVVDPGMWFLKTAAEQSGTGGHVHMQHWRTDGLPEAKEFFAAVDASLKGGKPNELQKFGGSLAGRGKPVDIVKPLVTIKTLTVQPAVSAFTLTVNGVTTASISNGSGGATAAAVQTAIRAVAGQGQAYVVGTAGGPFTITLIGDAATLAVSPTGGTATVAP